EDRLHALALRAGAGRDVDFSGRIDADGRALERSHAGALDIAAHAQTEISPFVPRRALALPKRGKAPDSGERLLQRRGIIAAVIGDRLAVAIRNARPIRHPLRADPIAPAAPRRPKPDPPRQAVHDGLP